MNMKKIGAMAASASMLTACVPPPQLTDYDDMEVVCKTEADVSTHIKTEKCTRVATDRHGMPQDEKPFKTNPVTGQRGNAGVSVPEGTCGGAND